MRTLRQIHAVSQRVAPWTAHVLACVIVGAYMTMQQLVQLSGLAS